MLIRINSPACRGRGPGGMLSVRNSAKSLFAMNLNPFKSRLLLFLLLTLLLAAALTWWMRQQKPIPVQLGNVERGEIQQTVTNTRAGSVKACQRAKLSPSVGGPIDQLAARKGARVPAGTVLLEIWNQDLQARVELARAQLLSGQAMQRQSCIQADLAAREAARQNELLKRGLTSDEQADRANGEARSRKAACDAAKANVSVNQAQLRVAEAALEHSRLRAPFDGVIASVNVERGEYVSPTPVGIPSDPVIDLIDDSCLYITAPMDEVDAPAIRVGMPTRISLDAFSNRFFNGQVKRIAPFVLDRERQSRSVDVDVDILPADDLPRFLPGYTADIEVILASHPDSLRIPTEALLEGSKVYRFDPDGSTISLVDVRTGISNWQYTEVLEGLNAGDRVVTSIERDGLADGVRVRPEKKSTK